MNWLLDGMANSLDSLSTVAWLTAVAQTGVVLFLQTSLLLGTGLIGLHYLRSRNASLRDLLGRALLFAVGAGAIVSVFLALGVRRDLPVLWNVSLPTPTHENPADELDMRRQTSPATRSEVVKVPNANPNNEISTSPQSSIANRDTPLSESVVNNAAENTPLDTFDHIAIALGTTRSAWQGLIALLAAVWLGGAALLLTKLAFCYGVLWRLLRRTQPIQDAHSQETLQGVCREMRVQTPPLRGHRSVESPFLAGLLRPTIVLPSTHQLGSQDGLKAIFLHEVAHLKRRDLWWNLFGQVARALLWPQPLLWMLCHSIEQSSEEACDEAVLRGGCQRHLYANCLLEWSQRLSPRHAERVAGAGVLSEPSSLSQRIRKILDSSAPLRRPPSKTVRWSVLAGALVAVGAMPLFVSSAPVSTSNNAGSRTGASAPTRVPLVSSRGRSNSNSRFLRTPDYDAMVGGMMPGKLQAVWIAEKRSDELTKVYWADMAQPEAGNLNRWILRKVVLLGYNQESGLVSRTEAEELRLQPASPVATFLAQKFRNAFDLEALRASQIQELRERLLPNDEEMTAAKNWARGKGHATLVGRVVNDEGRHVAGQKVSIFLPYEARKRIVNRQDENRGFVLSSTTIRALPRTVRNLFSQSTETDSNGNYRFSGVTGQDYVVTLATYRRNFELGEEAPLPEQVPTSFQTAKGQEGRTINVPSISLTRGGLVQVRVQDKDTGAALSDIHLVFQEGTRPMDLAPVYSMETDASGRSLFRLPAGKAKLSIGGGSLPGSHAFVAMSKGVPYNILRNATLSLEGKTPIPYAGTSEIQVFKNRTRQAVIRLERYIAPTPTPTPVLRPPPPGNATIEGRVVDESGAPVRGVPVSAMMQQAAKWKLMQGAGLAFSNGNTPNFEKKWASIHPVLSQHTKTRADGTFRLEGLTTAPYNLIVGVGSDFGLQPPPEGVATAVEGVWAKAGQVVRRSRPIVLQRGATIEVQVVDKVTGKGLGGVTFGSNGPQLPSSIDAVMGGTSDSRGRLTLRVAPGITSIYIAGPNQRATDENIVFADNGKPANVYRIGSSGRLYAGSNDVQFEIDGGAPQFGLNFGQDTERYIKVQTKNGESHRVVIRLRRLIEKRPQNSG